MLSITNRDLGQAHGNITNVFRIYAAIGRGAVKDENGETIEQVSFSAQICTMTISVR
jgi:hypothetical protein